jgi:hypothetical protein
MSMKSWIVAVLAVALGVGVSGALLIYTNPSRSEVEVYALSRSISGGDVITLDALHLEGIVVAGGAGSLFKRGDAAELQGVRAAHDLVAGALLQRSDVAPAQSVSDERLVFLPIKEAPPAVPGQLVDLLTVGGASDSPAVVPFALGIEVRAVVTGGLVVAVPSKEASAFVYAAEVMRLVAVIAAPDAHIGSEPPISSPDQAVTAVAQS